MLRKSFWIPVLGLLLVPAASAHAQKYLDAGTWELTLTGSGASNRDVNSGNAAVNLSIGYFIVDQLEITGRQSIGYNDPEVGPTGVAWSSSLAIDYHFDLDRFQPFIGAAVGYNYGTGVADTGIVGPEAGLKYFVKDDTFLYGLVQYQFFFHNSSDLSDNFDDGSFLYAIGIGFTW
jgi:outer membrane protein W